MITRYFLSIFLCITSSMIWAASIQVAKNPTFVDPNDIALELLPAPPAADSLAFQMDTTVLMWEQNTRTEYDANRAWGSVTLTPSYFNEALNARFEESRFPQLYALMNMVLADARLYVDAFKDQYKRPRPYQNDPKVIPIIPIEESTSYPSGHGTRGMTLALVFAEIFPKRSDVLIATGYTLGQDRVMGGVHYPSDISASVTLAQALAESIIASDAFKMKVNEAKDEIASIAKNHK